MKRLLAPMLFALSTLAATMSASAHPGQDQATAADAATAAPRPGLDFEVIAPAVSRFAPVKAKIEVVEVFSYACIHCAHFQPVVDKWLAHKPRDVQWEYVPAVFGGPFTNFAAAFYAADAAGVRERSHSAVFKAVFEEKAVKSGEPAEIADLYSRWGVDRAKFLAAMDSPAVREKMATAKGFAMVTGIQGTPTLIVNGKYRISVTTDRGFPGLLHTLDLALARERKHLAPPADGQAL